MWTLSPLGNAGPPHRLLPGQEYTVGRTNCWILLHNDQSISRAHAVLCVGPTSRTQDQAPTLTIKDTSKYGTFVNEARLDSGTPRVLQHGDLVTFGIFQSKFRVEYEALIVCSSCVGSEGKVSLTQDIQELGGRLVSSWSQDCTHLVMPAVKVTIKTICALLCCRPIVKPDFFSEFRKALQQKTAPPKAGHFCPEIDEPSLDRRDVQLGVKPQRRTLFQGKTFVFLGAKQLKRLSAVIAFGGGRVQLLEEGSLPVALLESPKTCVVDLETASSQALQSASTAQWSVSVARILQRKGLRMITESEIGLAAIYVTTDLYCNPSAQMNPEVVPDKPGITEATLSQSNAVDETTLPAASQNATAYAPDTEVLQGTARMDTSGPTSVGETPEKEQRQTERLSKRPTGADNPSKSAAAETTSTSAFSAKNLRNEKDVIPSTVKDNIQPVSKLPPTSAAKTKSPQKQTYSLTNYFLPISKKRNREGSEVGDESEAKLFRREEQEEDMENKLGHSIPRYSSLSRRTAATADPEPSVAALAVRPSSRSVDQGLSSSSTDHRPTAAKRKEMGKEDPTDDVTFEVEMEDLEDLESIMSLPMEDADKQKEACKRRRTELAAEVKQEEASFVQPPKTDSGISQQKQNAKSQPRVERVKTEAEDFDPVQRDKKEEDPPKNVLIVQFKSLVVDKPQRLRENPANPQMIFGKNFKRFQKVPVLGSTGLPKIIGGSDLVAHNRAKNSELEEWLREAAEEDNRTEWEETLGDDLFRYNPKPSKRR